MSWWDDAFVYQVYPLGALGAPWFSGGSTEGMVTKSEHRLAELEGWVEHLERLGANTLLLNPVFESVSHGYDTCDYLHVDARLGTNDDLAHLVGVMHEHGIRVMLDGVFNHVGRRFWAFEDVLQKKWDSPYCGWFNISFDGNSAFDDGFWYETWEGCDDIVKLNLGNPEVRGYLFDCVRTWQREFDIDGLRLDVAYCLDRQFLRELRGVANELGQARGDDFILLGETLHGDYNQWMADDGCHSVTNYECYKGLWSSVNSANMHEVAYAFERQSGSEPWDLYTGKHLLDFVDNHDVDRIATKLDDKSCLKPLYGLLFGIVGTPSVYYGSEWGIEGEKRPYDHEIRPYVAEPEWNELTDAIAAFAAARAKSEALRHGSYRQILCQPKQLLFERAVEGERVIVALNMDSASVHLDFDAQCGRAVDLVTGDDHDFGAGSDLPAYTCRFWLCER